MSGVGLKRAAVLTALTLAAAAPVVARADCQMSEIFDVPVKLEGTAAIVSVKINGAPARLEVDSGSYANSLSPSSAKKFNLFFALGDADDADGSRDNSYEAEGANGFFRQSLATARTLTLGGYEFKKVPFTIGGSDFGDVDGLIGQDLLWVADVDFDYKAGVVRFFKPKDCGAQALAFWAKPDQFFGVVEVRSSDPAARDFTGDAEVNGVKVKVLFDTGGGDSVLSLAAAKRAGITPQDAGAVSGGDLGGLGSKKVPTWIVPVKSFEIGGEKILNTRLRIAQWTGAGRLSSDMILGGDFFRSHHVFLANSQHRIYFTYDGGPVFDLSTGQAAAESK
jgi:predicted aspartyl protease